MIDLAVKQQQATAIIQEQSLTQEQIQAIEMLAAPAIELRSFVNEELEKNPVLEADADEMPQSEDDEHEHAETAESGDDDEWIRQLLELDDAAYRKPMSVHAPGAEEEARRQHRLNSIPATEQWENSLIEQIRFLNPEPHLFECAEMIVASLDRNAYLSAHPADIAMAMGLPLDTVMQALRIVQSCDPAGVAARDLRERLQLQLQRRGETGTLACRLVGEHLDDLASNRIPTLVKRLSVSQADLQEAMETIRTLRPHVICDHSDDTREAAVQAEVEVAEENGHLNVSVRSHHIPTLRINSHYRALLASDSTPPETRDYIKDKIRRAAFLINSLGQRQSTLERIARAIVDAQEAFFKNGIDAMRPLTMGEVAQKIGVHETTVSRGVAAKYLECKFGLVPMRQFFSNGYCDSEGRDVSNIAVKNAVRRFVENEDPHRPLSDSCIAERLRRSGLNVARRTVAKYRESMGILSSKLRRQYW